MKLWITLTLCNEHSPLHHRGIMLIELTSNHCYIHLFVYTVARCLALRSTTTAHSYIKYSTPLPTPTSPSQVNGWAEGSLHPRPSPRQGLLWLRVTNSRPSTQIYNLQLFTYHLPTVFKICQSTVTFPLRSFILCFECYIDIKSDIYYIINTQALSPGLENAFNARGDY